MLIDFYTGFEVRPEYQDEYIRNKYLWRYHELGRQQKLKYHLANEH